MGVGTGSCAYFSVGNREERRKLGQMDGRAPPRGQAHTCCVHTDQDRTRRLRWVDPDPEEGFGGG
jgi:hypothetical protein